MAKLKLYCETVTREDQIARASRFERFTVEFVWLGPKDDATIQGRVEMAFPFDPGFVPGQTIEIEIPSSAKGFDG